MSIIVNILENFLGGAHSHYENKAQVQFDCPMCSQEKGEYGGDGKGNLAINYERAVYKCWSCWERNNMFGTLLSLVKNYGNRQHYRDYLLVAPKINKSLGEAKTEEKIIVELPKSYRKFSESSIYYTNHNESYTYVKSRGLTNDLLERFQIGYTNEGNHKNRIIIPSFDVNGELNYYIARSYDKWNKFKYLNPEAEKKSIIFNEYLVNWNSTVYLVEGAFDHIVTPNSIPLLGKFVSDKLFHNLQTRCKGDVVIVLDGGKEERRDSMVLYRKLNTINLYNRIKVVFIKDGVDLSLINQQLGPKGILKSLRTANKIKESRL